MDEKDFLMGAIQKSHILLPMHEKDALVRQDGILDWVSVIEAILAMDSIFQAILSSKLFNQHEDCYKS
jgi:hypothetical protein